MDPELQALSTQFAEVVLKNSAAGISDQIRAFKARKQDKETIAALEEIISDLLNDKSELVRIGQAYEQELGARRISDPEMKYISESVIPVLKDLAALDSDDESAQEKIEALKPLLSVKTFSVLQLLGFNFRKAIGGPLTELLAGYISSAAPAAPTDSSLSLEVQKLGMQVAQDPAAYERLRKLFGHSD